MNSNACSQLGSSCRFPTSLRQAVPGTAEARLGAWTKCWKESAFNLCRCPRKRQFIRSPSGIQELQDLAQESNSTSPTLPRAGLKARSAMSLLQPSLCLFLRGHQAGISRLGSWLLRDHDWSCFPGKCEQQKYSFSLPGLTELNSLLNGCDLRCARTISLFSKVYVPVSAEVSCADSLGVLGTLTRG